MVLMSERFWLLGLATKCSKRESQAQASAVSAISWPGLVMERRERDFSLAALMRSMWSTKSGDSRLFVELSEDMMSVCWEGRLAPGLLYKPRDVTAPLLFIILS